MLGKNNLNSLREIIRRLEKENERLKQLLNKANISYDVISNSQEEDDYDLNQADRIKELTITKKLANEFFYYFWGRKDVYAKRGAKGGYYPQCNNRWIDICPKNQGIKTPCGKCKESDYKELSIDVIFNHLKGMKEDCSDVIGIYPLFEDDTCRLIVFDFDNHEKLLSDSEEDNTVIENLKEEVNILRQICIDNGFSPLVERSRSAKAHIYGCFLKNQ